MTREETVQDSKRSNLCPVDAEVRAALDRVTSMPPLARSKRLCEFLSYIVNETLAGRSDKISGYAIAVDVYGKPEHTDQTIDTTVRVEAGRLRRSLDQYYREEGREEPVEIVIPKGAYLPEFRYRTKDRIISAKISPSTRSDESETENDRGPSIAVLPFENYSADPDDQFFADGLTEETIANLSRFKDLFVFSRSTTSKLARDGADSRQLRDEMDVDFVVEGSVRKTPQVVRVTVQLIDAATDGHILSESFDRPCTPEGVFEIQDEIALLIAGRIADRYGPLGRYIKRAGRGGQSKNWETYHWITRFYDYYATHHPDTHLEVRDGLTAALVADPASSDGHAALSIVLLDEYRLHINARPSFPALDQALLHAQLAVVSDPENAFAYQASASAYFHMNELTDFKVAADHALRLNPGHTDVLADIGFCYCLLEDWNTGLPMLDRAIELSPVHPGWYHMPRAGYLMMNGDPSAAVVEMKKMPMPGFFWYHAHLAGHFALAGELENASKEIEQLKIVRPDFVDVALCELEIWNVGRKWGDKIIEGLRAAGLEIAEYDSATRRCGTETS